MIYLDSIRFPSEDEEWAFRMSIKRTCYSTIYPFYLIPQMGLERLDFAPITILYGGNGSGKTTLLNVIGETLRLNRDAPYNKSTFFDDYVKLCHTTIEEDIPEGSRIITSDDVFDYMLNLRALNQGIDRKREELFDDYYEARHNQFKVRSLDDFDELKKRNNARRKTQSAFVRGELQGNVREQSNGESAAFFFRDKIQSDALYLLDEPENSLSAARQIELAEYLEESARLLGCQLVISTHSPFLLAMKDAKIYDIDSRPVTLRRWTDLPNVRAYYDFFAARSREFSARSAPAFREDGRD